MNWSKKYQNLLKILQRLFQNKHYRHTLTVLWKKEN